MNAPKNSIRTAVDFDPARFRDRGSHQTAVIHE